LPAFVEDVKNRNLFLWLSEVLSSSKVPKQSAAAPIVKKQIEATSPEIAMRLLPPNRIAGKSESNEKSATFGTGEYTTPGQRDTQSAIPNDASATKVRRVLIKL